MSHWRSDYRKAARDSLSASERFSGIEILRSWAGGISDNTLPVIGVLTPSEQVSVSAQKQSERGTLMQIVLKREGGEDVEDILDDDSDEIEARITGALLSSGCACFLEAVSVVTNGDGRKRIGTLLMDFRIKSWRPIVRAT